MAGVAIHKVVNMTPEEVARAANKEDLLRVAKNLGWDVTELSTLELGELRETVFKLSSEKGREKAVNTGKR